MNDFAAYRDFVKNTAPAAYKKEIDRSCLGLLIFLPLAVIALQAFGWKVDLWAQLPSVVLIALIYLTDLPVFALLLAVYGGGSVVFSLLNAQGFNGYLLLAAGLTLYFTTRRLRSAFRSFRDSGSFSLPEKPSVIIGAGRSTGKEAFTARCACPDCGMPGLRVVGTKYSRFTLRYSNHSADWETFCPSCGKTTAIKSGRAKKLALESGQFVAYRRAEFIDWWLVLLALSLVSMLFGLILSLFILHSDASIYAQDIAAPSLRTGQQFIGEDLRIIDCFAIETESEAWDEDWSNTDQIQAVYMTASFENEAGSWLLPVKVLPDKDIFAACCAFAADYEAELLTLNVHGYIDRLPADVRPLFEENAEGWASVEPSLEGLSNMVIYWDGETAPSSDKTAERVFQIMAVAGALLSALFFMLDRYANSEERAARVQERYEQKR